MNHYQHQKFPLAKLYSYFVSSTYTALIIQMKTKPVWYRWLYL